MAEMSEPQPVSDPEVTDAPIPEDEAGFEAAQSLTNDKKELERGENWAKIDMNGSSEPSLQPEIKGDAPFNEHQTSNDEGEDVKSPSDAPPTDLPAADEQPLESPPLPSGREGDTSSARTPEQLPPGNQDESPAPHPARSSSIPSVSIPAAGTPRLTESRARSGTQSSAATNATLRAGSSTSLVFVVTALESIAASKDARKKKPLGEATQRALSAIKSQGDPQLTDPETVFEALRLATEASNNQVVVTALDCIGKLISYSYFAVSPESNASPDGTPQEPALIERAIDAICDCFQGEATASDVQLQILKSLLAAVLNDKVVVHGAGLLKAVRQTYNIFLLSRSSGNQQIAQGTLTQMVGTVFERVKTRISLKEASLNASKASLGRDMNGSGDLNDINRQSPEAGENGVESPPDKDDESASVAAPEAESIQPESQPEPNEKITLQSFENRKSFDDDRINDNAPTMVTRIKKDRTISGFAGANDTAQANLEDNEPSEEDEEDEIYIKDAFLVFRAMCKLSTKTLPPEQVHDIKSHGMRSKLLSLHLIHTIIDNNVIVFTSPLATIRSSAASDPTSFVQAIKQYLCLSLSRNGGSSVIRVFEVGCEIFWLMLKHMRVMLKREIEVFLKEIYLAILDRRNAPLQQKQYLMSLFERLCNDPRALVELYLNYDCDRNTLENIFQRMIEHLSRISSSPVMVTAMQQQQYQEFHQRNANVAPEWHQRGTLPPSLSTANIQVTNDQEPTFPIEYSLKQQSLECLVETLRSLVNWAQQGIADTTADLGEAESRNSVEGFRDSVDAGNAVGLASPRIGSIDTPGGPTTPLAEDDPQELGKAKQRKTALINGIRQFNYKPSRGISYLIKEGFVRSDSPEDIARFLIQNDRLDKAMLGEYLGDGEPQNIAIMHAFVDAMDFTRTRFVDALRRFLQSFRLPGEAQKIDRFMLKFAERYMTGNPNAFANADTAYVLSYSVILLNTDQHSTKMKGRRMTKEDFIKNNRGINDNANLPDEYLGGIYDEIASNEIVLDTERENAAALGLASQPSGGLAAGIGQALATVGRDLQREAYAQASEEMANKAEKLFRSLLRAQRKTAARSGLPRFIPATSFKHVGPMFEVSWMSFLSGLSGQVHDTQNIETIKLCMEGFKLSIRVACLFDLEMPRTAFVTALAKFTNLNNLSEMKAKNMEALKALLEVAQTEGNLLKESWRDILTCISQLDRFQLLATGVDEGEVPDVLKARILTQPKQEADPRRSLQPPRRIRPKSISTSASFQPDIVEETQSTDMNKAMDRIFTNTANLSGEAIVHFVRALTEVSWEEIQSSGQSESPRTFSLQKLVEISGYNMTRVRFEWTNIWQVLGEHFNQVGCHTNTHVVFFALNSLRQLSMRFMEIEELPGFKFQKDFLKPFEHVMSNSGVVAVKDMVLRCLIQMIQARGQNIRSGWRTMFAVFTVAAREPYENIVNLAYDNVTQIYNSKFGVVISQGAFADLMVCLTEFSKNAKFQKKSLQAIETLKSTIPKMLKTPECPLSIRHTPGSDKAQRKGSVTSAQPLRQTQEEQYWFPILFAFHDVLMTGVDLEARSRALNYLFDSLINYGGDFPPEFWDILWRQLLYPIFMVLKSKSEMTKVLNHEELSVWLSTTMIQALRNMITLFTHYFKSLEYMLDRFLELLILCICQENDTIARIGSNCLQQLILQNVTKFTDEHWNQTVGAFVELFDRTTAHQLFSAATVSGPSPSAPVSSSNGLTRLPVSDASSISDLPMPRKAAEDEINGPLAEPSPDSGEADVSPANGTGDDSEMNASTLIDEPSAAGGGSSVETQNTPPTELEDYKPQTAIQKQPVVVTAARRRFFNQIITKCVLQLLIIETVNELFSNDAVYHQIPSPELLRLMGLLKTSFQFAKRFNANKELRMRLWREGFMKQPPNLLKQESGSAATYVSILLRMYHDEGEERKRNRADTEAALIPLCVDIINGYVQLDEETQQRNIVAWRPVVVDVMEGYTHFPREGFEKHIETFYPLVIGLLSRDMSTDIRLALQALLRRVGEVKMGMEPFQGPVGSPPISPGFQFSSRRPSRGR
ncbi:transport protein sec71 [Xylona heveae TC161]|uniref:Transport protein sec71 n=1 Tax=Xylona heveae (strain CBS 132557 / TC161) TaxID=1328760 RepID=A0A161TC67_XYLHT|nr:transport protein sec71 [Xylona heveae TC161]KZF23347.1 transport protein sec71 [Xylona heveae TC161]